jgi:hypothetical protein
MLGGLNSEETQCAAETDDAGDWLKVLWTHNERLGARV